MVTAELKWLRKGDRPDDATRLGERLHGLACDALAQIAEKGYDAPDVAAGRACVRIGLGFSPSQVAVVSERLPDEE